MGLKLLKFHGITHMALDIMQFGVPELFNTGCNESHHKDTKAASKLTQKDLVNFLKSTALRLWEFYLVFLALQEMQGARLWEYWEGYPNKLDPSGFKSIPFAPQNHPYLKQDFLFEESDGEEDGAKTEGELDEVAQMEAVSRTGGTRIQVSVDRDSNQVQYRFVGSRLNRDEFDGWEASIVEYLVQLQAVASPYLPDGGFLDIRTEHKRNKIMFRGHPWYRVKGSWNDWVKVDWGENQVLPAAIWCFVDLTKLKQEIVFDQQPLSKGVYAVVETANYDDNDPETLESDLFNPIRIDVDGMDDGKTTVRRFFFADVEAFVEPIVVVPNIGGQADNMYLEVAPRREWAEDFEIWLKSNNDDTIEFTDEEENGDDEEESDDE